SISGNTADRGGGGVNIEGKDGIFTMNVGTISGNHGNSWGGGVNVDEGIFTMSGGSISGNTVSSGAGYPIRVGGGVMIELGTFNMSGGIIDGNTAPYGGGVYVDDGDFYKTGGIIYGRTPEGAPNWNRAGSDTRGHAVYADGGNSSLSNAKYRDTTAGSEVNLTAVKGAATGDGWMP
ncbi:MAG: hypothetical protein LBU45_08930, partial [Azoarcus sp.]|nr:hypothetical protein [Azoarcus sp.]